MPNYRYTARDERGKAVAGTLPASNPEALADQLKRMGYLVTQARELGNGLNADLLTPWTRRIRYDDLVLFNVQLSKMVRVGIPLTTALEALTQQTANPVLAQAVRDVAKNVEGGQSFSEALARHPAIFSPLFVSMVKAGEISGKLDDILRRFAMFSKQQATLRQQLQTAMTYPMALLVVGCGAMAFLVTGIIPKFMKIFLDAGITLPLPTQLLYQLSQGLRNDWPLLVGALGLIGLGVRAMLLTSAGRRRRDLLLLTIPVVGDLVRKAAISRMARTLETLFSSGVSVLESLEIAQQTCGNAAIADVCRSAYASVKQGGTLSAPLQASPGFPPMVVQMVKVGESSGTLDQMLGEIADHYDELVQHGVKRLTTLIEPAFLVVMGGMVAFIMGSILLPLFRMVNVVRGH